MPPENDQPRLKKGQLPPHDYRLMYSLPDPKAGHFKQKEIVDAGMGGTDAYIYHSLLYPPDGSFSQYFDSFDGRNGGKALPDEEMFKVWMMMGQALSDPDRPGNKNPEDKGSLDPYRRLLAGLPFRMFFAKKVEEELDIVSKFFMDVNTAMAKAGGGKDDHKTVGEGGGVESSPVPRTQSPAAAPGQA